MVRACGRVHDASKALRPVLEHSRLRAVAPAAPSPRAGFQAYLSGDWATARAVLEETLHMRRGCGGEPVEDGPSAALLGVMADSAYRAPQGWAGSRALAEK